MQKYLSHGMGVNSTALMLLLKEHKIDFESVFVNHGGDYPETYRYVEYIREQGFEITTITPPMYCGCTTIEQYIRKYKFLPGIFARWCTEHFKVIPFLKYIETPSVVYLGYAFDEKKRAIRRETKHKKENEILYKYPLIDAEMNRNDCVDIIKNHDLEVPSRSTCFFCPFQSKLQIRDLLLYHRDLYERVKELENSCSRNGKFTLKSKPINEIAMENTPPIQKWLV